LRQISAYTLHKFIETIRKGTIIHDINISETMGFARATTRKLIKFKSITWMD